MLFMVLSLFVWGFLLSLFWFCLFGGLFLVGFFGFCLFAFLVLGFS